MLNPKKGCDTLCDDGCDALMLEELMSPAFDTLPLEADQRVIPAPLPETSGKAQPIKVPNEDTSPVRLNLSEPHTDVSPTVRSETVRLIPPPIRDPKSSGTLAH